ncbi:MAG: hypothetical protein GY822_15355 [Deltaproteobacteria bacterium]|nr:hypothetical protein [Deltaproteobacteria bacterium]
MSNLWHLEERGIPPLLVEENERTRSNRYAPWPEKKLTLQLSRPKGIGGQALTIDKSRLVLQPGIRATDATLSLTLRASRRDSHGLNVPEGAEVSKLTIDNRNHPIRVKDGVLSFSTKQQSRGSQTSANAPIEKKEGETPSSSAASAQALLKEEPRNPAQDGEQEDVSKPKKDAD